MERCSRRTSSAVTSQVSNAPRRGDVAMMTSSSPGIATVLGESVGAPSTGQVPRVLWMKYDNNLPEVAAPLPVAGEDGICGRGEDLTLGEPIRSA